MRWYGWIGVAALSLMVLAVVISLIFLEPLVFWVLLFVIICVGLIQLAIRP